MKHDMTDIKPAPQAASPQQTSPEQLLALLDQHDLVHKTYHHQPVFTVQEAQQGRELMAGGHSKNLFLRNKKGHMWLFSTLDDKPIDLKKLGEQLGAGRLSFGSNERLEQYLGVKPGSVTPLAVINDKQNAVTLVLDQELMAHALVNFHPLINTMTCALTPAQLYRFFELIQHPYQLLSCDFR